jgi:hypothetical protein
VSPESNFDPENRIVTGAIWRHKRDRFRQVEITGLFSQYGERYVGVWRNTSRRRQAIKETTLLRDYAFDRFSRT